MRVLGVLFSLIVSVSAPVAPMADPQLEATLVDVETQRFHLRATPRAEGAARLLSEEIEQRRDEIARLLGRDWPGVTEVRVGFGREQFEKISIPGGTPPSWAVALAYPGRNVILVDAHSLALNDGQQTFRHELVHVALGQLGDDWPHWFQEGLAQELIGERQFDVSTFTMLAEAAVAQRIFALDDLRDRFPDRPRDVELAYAQSAAFLRFLRERHSSHQFAELIDGVSAGQPFETAFAKAFHASLAFEERAFREDLPRRYPWWVLLAAGGSVAWGLLSFAVVFGAIRRRRANAALRAEQHRMDVIEESAAMVLDAIEHPANNDVIDPRHADASPWFITSHRYLVNRAARRNT